MPYRAPWAGLDRCYTNINYYYYYYYYYYYDDDDDDDDDDEGVKIDEKKAIF